MSSSKNAGTPGPPCSCARSASVTGETCPKWRYGLMPDAMPVPGSFLLSANRSRPEERNFSKRRRASSVPPRNFGDGRTLRSIPGPARIVSAGSPERVGISRASDERAGARTGTGTRNRSSCPVIFFRIVAAEYSSFSDAVRTGTTTFASTCTNGHGHRAATFSYHNRSGRR